MGAPEQPDEQAQDLPARLQSVSATILGQFFDELEKEEGFSDVAPKLRKVVLDDGVFAEPSIRATLFPSAS
jgi:hypothetical protein